MISIENVPEPGLAMSVFEWSLFAPVPGQEENTIVFEDRDGTDIRGFTAEAVQFWANGKVVFRIDGTKTGGFVTDARVAIACSKYDKGGGWIGGPIEMAVFNTASKVRAAVGRRGKMLVSQVRYPWIQNVGSTSRVGWGSYEALVLDTKGGSDDIFRLTLRLPNDADAAGLAAEIVRRAAAYRLATDSNLGDDERAKIEELAVARPLTPTREKNKIHFFRMPTFWYVTEKSARLVPPAYAPRQRDLRAAAEDWIHSVFADRRGPLVAVPLTGWSDGLTFGQSTRSFEGRDGARAEAATRVADGAAQVFVLSDQNVDGQSCVVCEAYEPKTGAAVTVIQPYAKRLGAIRADGSPRVSDHAPPLAEA